MDTALSPLRVVMEAWPHLLPRTVLATSEEETAAQWAIEMKDMPVIPRLIGMEPTLNLFLTTAERLSDLHDCFTDPATLPSLAFTTTASSIPLLPISTATT